MVALGTALASVNLGFRVVDGVKKLFDEGNTDNNIGAVYDKVKELKTKRAHLYPSLLFEMIESEDDEHKKSKDAVESDAVQAIKDLYREDVKKGVVNVLYDLPGTGKSMAGLSLLDDFYLLPKARTLQGLMVSTQASSGSYVEVFADLLEASNTKGWLSALLLAMNEPHDRLPSLLILDDFSLDTTGENIKFIENLYKLMNPPKRDKLNIIVVVMTQRKDAADALCHLNGGVRVVPIKGFYETKKDDVLHNMMKAFKLQTQERVLTHPTWKGSRWTTSLLIEVLKYHLKPADFVSLENTDFVQDGMTPFQVLQKATSMIESRMAGEPTSPRKSGQGKSFG
mmetsp:Transcript_787/g.2296  ORF Transcript_787/g.2296 Transcript_787/m.2296 type:complete len:340 (-) Transcript_787:1611-2630(-)